MHFNVYFPTPSYTNSYIYTLSLFEYIYIMYSNMYVIFECVVCHCKICAHEHTNGD